MPIPPNSILTASARWLSLLDSDTLERSRNLLHTSKKFHDITPTQYNASLTWLIQQRLIAPSGQLLFQGNLNEAIFREAIKGSIWFEDESLLLGQGDDIPVDAELAASSLGISLGRAMELIRSTWVKFNSVERHRIGLQGELLLVQLLSGCPGVSVSHIALESDILGYDIVAFYNDQRFNLEVKSTTRTNRIGFFLSRNEYEVSLEDKCWRLVLIILKDGKISNLFEIDKKVLQLRAPADTERHTKWQSAYFEIDQSILLEPIPELFKKSTNNF